MGAALLKGNSSRTKWAPPRQGLTRSDWASVWIVELSMNDLPGKDFVVRAPSVALDQWLDRPARYADFSRALRLLLMLFGRDIVFGGALHTSKAWPLGAGLQYAKAL